MSLLHHPRNPSSDPAAPDRCATESTASRPSRRQPRWRRVLAVSALTLSAFAGGALTSPLSRASLDDHSPYAVLGQLSRVLVLIENQYVDAVDRERLLNGAIKGMVAELDPHSSYLPPRDFTVLQDDTRGEFAGIGVEVDFRNDRVTVIAPIEGSPASRAGIRAGDSILTIDGSSVQGKNAADLVKLMRGPAGTTVRISVRRPGQDAILRFAMTRQVIEVSSVLGADLDGQVAYLRIKQFQSKTPAELLAAIGKVRADMGDIKGVLLDLRNNPGGLVAAASAVADEFLSGGAVYSTRHRGQVVDEVHAGGSGALEDEPMVVLVNEFSASASELLAGALQDHQRASIVGARTFGKGSVQSIIDLPGGGGLRLTTMRYYTPAGNAIQVAGITPNVLVDSALSGGGGVTVVREHDLENHLRSENGPEAASAPARTGDPVAAENDSNEAVGLSATHLGVARSVASDPSNGPDHALSVAYQLLRDQLKKKP
jgi:carboxyl-terminal processing protease